MASEDSDLTQKKRPHEHDLDDVDLDIRKKDVGSRSLLTILAVVGVGLVLLTCLASVGIGIALSVARDDTAAKLPGSWKSRWVLPGQVIDSTYIFRKDGSFREESFNLNGQRVNVSEGRWRVHNGQVEIDWDNGGFEVATVAWVDEKTLTYRVVDHSDEIQKGMVVTLRRQ